MKRRSVRGVEFLRVAEMAVTEEEDVAYEDVANEEEDVAVLRRRGRISNLPSKPSVLYVPPSHCSQDPGSYHSPTFPAKQEMQLPTEYDFGCGV